MLSRSFNLARKNHELIVQGTHFRYSAETIGHYVQAARRNDVRRLFQEQYFRCSCRALAHLVVVQVRRMKPMDRWLSEALDAHPVKGIDIRATPLT